MMKKLFSVSAVAAGVMLSGQALATTAAIANSETLTPAHCPALANNVTIQISKDVVAGFNCGNYSFAAATCHKTGTNKAQTVTAQFWDDDGDPLTPMVVKDGYTNCSDTDAVPDGIVDVCSFNGRVGFRGTSAGGQVGAVPLGDTPCSTIGVVTMVPDTELDASDTSGTTQP
jgi:hypothetical protein